MKIQTTNYSVLPKKNNNTAFGHQSSYIYLKDIRGNHCACCGKELIPSSDISVAWSRITRPLSEILKEGRFVGVKTDTPEVYKLLLNFAQHYPDESLDGIISVPQNHYELMTEISRPFTDDVRLSALSGQVKNKQIKSRFMKLLQRSSFIMKDALEVMRNLEPLEHYLYGYKKDIFEELSDLAQRFPNQKINEILKRTEVRTPYIENTYHEAMEFAGIRDEHWNKANKIILDRKPELKEAINQLHTEICRIYRNVMDPSAVAYELKQAYKKLLSSYQLYSIESEVMNEVAQMPTNLFSKSSFLSYARRYNNDGVIIDYTIKPFMETIEHILAVSDGGSNDSRNIIMMCKNCNHNRKNDPYYNQVKIHPEMIINTGNQIRFYGSKILSGEISPTLESYPIEVSQTLYECSNGIMKYNLDDYISALAKKHAAEGH